MEKYIHAFWHITGASYDKLVKIDRYFGDFRYAWEKAEQIELEEAGLGKEYIDDLLNWRRKLDLEKSLDLLWRNDIFLVGKANQEFPEELRHIGRPPYLLYRKGQPINELTRRVAIVGMRKSSLAGEKLTFSLAKSLSTWGITVISGLAFGIDAAAHAGTLQNDGRTIGVLASGINKVTPATHQHLADKILSKGGALISEYPMTTNTWKYQFVERNRIIAGLANTVIVIEAAKRSGALITAKYALEQGKEILAFPGDPGRIQSQGCNNLIKKGEAQLVDSIKDVQESLIMRGMLNDKLVGEKLVQSEWSIFDKKIYDLIKMHEYSTDQLDSLVNERADEVERTQLLTTISKLEIAGLIYKNSQFNWQISAIN